jgi:hypothetical protein
MELGNKKLVANICQGIEIMVNISIHQFRHRKKIHRENTELEID